MPGALVNGAATSDRVLISANAAVNSLSAGTWICLLNVTTLTSLRRIWSKINAATSFRGIDAYLSGTGGFVAFDCFTAAGSTSRVTSSIPITVNTWWKLAFVLDLSQAQQMHIYLAPLGTALAEPTYSTNTNAAGATASNDSAADLAYGNTDSFGNALQGLLGPSAVFGAALSMADCESWCAIQRVTVGSSTAGMFGRPGKNAADFIEYTGKTAVVTGSTQGNGPALVYPFAFDDDEDGFLGVQRAA